MLFDWRLIAVALLLASSQVVAGTAGSWVKRSLPIGSEWQRRAPATESVSVHVAIRASQNEIPAIIANISDPCNPQYGQYYNQSAIEQFITPSKAAKRAVDEWLSGHGVQKRSEGHDWFSVELPVDKASAWLGGADFGVYEHVSGKRKLHVRDYSVPSHIDEHVELIKIDGTASIIKEVDAANDITPEGNNSQGAPAEDSDADGDDDNDGMDASDGPCSETPYTVVCLRSLYNMSNYQMQAPDRQRILVAGFVGQHASTADLQEYLQDFTPERAQYNISELVNITDINVTHGFEANLDLQIVASNVLPMPVTFYYVGGHGPSKKINGQKSKNEPYLEFFSYLVSLPDNELPQVVSISYSDAEESLGREYATKVCDYVALLGLRGTTVVSSSGNDGVGSHELCGADDEFIPVFPASCPYVTAVGGTMGSLREQVGSEALMDYYAGSGYSNFFDRPSFQDDAVNTYMDTANKFRGRFNANGRAYPDIAMMSDSTAAVINGSTESFVGTSIAAPLAASFIAMVNDARIAAGQPVLGYLNPILYTHIAPTLGTFRDIVDGATSGCGGGAFEATQSWDVASGFGAPLFDPFRDAALNVQCPAA
ncbi:tripeptidyl-peptidase I [Malassezia cuniculi]|uniref:tripeptidyl-peptidase II n=1 Tax=Malassezia cuniculi TaxID=948313 RepID=A0AAF0EVJ1_9BASI|nr:tripeptidyl-peptidase I [Malassezia cuniculi]